MILFLECQFMWNIPKGAEQAQMQKYKYTTLKTAYVSIQPCSNTPPPPPSPPPSRDSAFLRVMTPSLNWDW